MACIAGHAAGNIGLCLSLTMAGNALAISAVIMISPLFLPRLLHFLDNRQIASDTVTLVFDKGLAALYNTLHLGNQQVLG
jgi:hypothetical protein